MLYECPTCRALTYVIWGDDKPAHEPPRCVQCDVPTRPAERPADARHEPYDPRPDLVHHNED